MIAKPQKFLSGSFTGAKTAAPQRPTATRFRPLVTNKKRTTQHISPNDHGMAITIIYARAPLTILSHYLEGSKAS
jgi:hypothetical protein